MTLIVGVKCRDGIVMGADSLATYTASGNRTIRNERCRKLSLWDDKIIVGVSGAVGLSQRIGPAVSDLWKKQATQFTEQAKALGLKPLPLCKPHEAMNVMRRVLYDQIWGLEMQAAQQANQAGWPWAANDGVSLTLVALPLTTGPALICFNPTGAPEEVSESLYCSAIGSGQPIADPFLGFLRQVLWNNEMPSVAEASVGVLWCLDHAIAHNAGGVGGEVQICVLEKRGTVSQVRELKPSDYAEAREQIAAASKILNDWHHGKLPTADAPKLPDPPSDKPKTG